MQIYRGQYQEDECNFYNLQNLSSAMFPYIQQNHFSDDLYDQTHQESENPEAGNNHNHPNNLDFSSTDDQKLDESYIKIQKQNYQQKIRDSQF